MSRLGESRAGDDSSNRSGTSVIDVSAAPKQPKGRLFGSLFGSSKSSNDSLARARRSAATDWDVNEDKRLDRDELKAMARADGERFDRFMAADMDGDGVLDSNELRIAEEAEDQHNRVLVLKRVKDAYKHRLEKRASYWTLLFFTLFLCLYLGLLYQQADVEAAFGMTSAVTNALVPTNPETDEVRRVYADKSEVFTWLKTTFGPIWADPKCGDGECSQMEFPGFGPFGCTADCGAYTHLTRVDVEITPVYSLQDGSDEVDSKRAAFLSGTKWNFCTKELRPEIGEECWYVTDRVISNYVGTTDKWTLEVPGLNWYVRLVAPFGGTSGKVFITDPKTKLKKVAYTWGHCEVTGTIAKVTPDGYDYSLYAAAKEAPSATSGSRKLLGEKPLAAEPSAVSATGRQLQQVQDLHANDKNILGQTSTTCGTGEKKLLILTALDTLHATQKLKAFLTKYDSGHTHTAFDSPYANDKPQWNPVSDANVQPGDDYGETPVFSEDDAIFPEAVEVCVPETENEFSLWMAFLEGSPDLNQDNDQHFNYGRMQTPSFAIMDEAGCFAQVAAGDECEPFEQTKFQDNNPYIAEAPAIFPVCPTKGVKSKVVKVTLSATGAACEGFHGLGDYTAPDSSNDFVEEEDRYAIPEVALMEAIESGFSIPQFSTSISDPPQSDPEIEDAPCPAGTKEIYVVVESPWAGLDTFAYGIRSVTDSNKVTKIRSTGGTMISPERYRTADGEALQVKFPSRWQYGQYMFYDCQPDGAQPGAPNVNMGGYTIETLAGEAKGSSVWEESLRWFNENPIGSGNPFWGPCDFSTQTYPFKKTRQCAAIGTYTLQATATSPYIKNIDTKVYVTDANGCPLAGVDVPLHSTHPSIPETVKDTFQINSFTGSSYSVDPNGVPSCAVRYSKQVSRAPSATPPEKPKCDEGFRLIETVTQTSWMGSKNEWEVQHVIFNDTAIIEAGIDTTTVNLDAFSSHILAEAQTDMRRPRGQDNQMSVDQWCIRPGNYSLIMSDGYRTSTVSDKGWRGGGVFITGADECEIVKSFGFTRHADGTTQGTTDAMYFTITAGDDADIKGRNCTAAGMTIRDFAKGWCTFDTAASSTMCKAVDSRSPITASSTPAQKRCKEGVCRNPRCHEPIHLSGYRTVGDTSTGCCKQIEGATPFALKTMAVPKSSDDAPPPVPVDTTVRKRYVSSKNVIVGGVFLHQTRSGTEPCTGKFGDRRAGKSLSGSVCPVMETRTVDPYGVDPFFISTSSLYKPTANNLMCCRPESGAVAGGNTTGASSGSNSSDPSSKFFYKQSELNIRGIPYGFYPTTLDGREDGFAVVIDVNLREKAFNKLMTYLEDGFFVDKYTDNLKVEVLTYNGELRYFCNLIVDFDFSQGGNILVKYSADIATTQPYFHDKNVKAEVDKYNFRRLLEALFCLFVFLAMFTEVYEIGKTWLKTGHLMDYFASVWNYIEVSSITLHIACIAMWVWQVEELRTFDTEQRYDVYLDTQHEQTARILELKDNGNHLRAFAVNVLSKFNSVIQVQVIYGTFNGINIFLCLLRFFKAADFQPKLGIVTRTIGKSFQELAHFFSLLAIVCLMYTFLGQVVFGSKLLQFSSLSQAAQTIIAWTLSGDDRGVGEELFDLPGNLAVAGALFYMTFSFITTLMLLNFLIAILSDGYMRVQEESAASESFISEMGQLFVKWLKAKTSRGKLLSDDAALRRVRALLGAEDKERKRFKEKHGLRHGAARAPGGGESDSDGEDDFRATSVEFVGDNGAGIQLDELRRVLEGSHQTAKRAVSSGSKKAQRGLGDVDVLCDSIVQSVGNAKREDHASPMEKKVAETHSLVLLMMKQLTEQQVKLDQQQRSLDTLIGPKRGGGEKAKPEAGSSEVKS